MKCNNKLVLILALFAILILSTQNSFATTSSELDKIQEICNDNSSNNNGLACRILGIMYQKGNGVTQDLAKAEDLYQKGCDLDDGLACAFLGGMYTLTSHI